MKEEDDTCFSLFEPGPPVLSLYTVPSNCDLVFHMTCEYCFTPHLLVRASLPRTPLTPRLCTLCLLRHSPLSQRSLSFPGTPASALLCAHPVLCPLQLQRGRRILFCSRLFPPVSALPRRRAESLFSLTVLISPRTP